MAWLLQCCYHQVLLLHKVLHKVLIRQPPLLRRATAVSICAHQQPRTHLSATSCPCLPYSCVLLGWSMQLVFACLRANRSGYARQPVVCEQTTVDVEQRSSKEKVIHNSKSILSLCTACEHPRAPGCTIWCCTCCLLAVTRRGESREHHGSNTIPPHLSAHRQAPGGTQRRIGEPSVTVSGDAQP